MNNSATPSRSFSFLESHGDGIYAEPLTSLRRTVVEDMSEMTATPLTRNFYALHPERVVRVELDTIITRVLIKTRPATTRLELRVRCEQDIAASSTDIVTYLVKIDILPRERTLSTLLPKDMVLFVGQPFLPVRLRFRNLLHRSYRAPTISLDALALHSTVHQRHAPAS